MDFDFLKRKYLANYLFHKNNGKPMFFRVDIHPISGCNSRCLMCDNWRNPIKTYYSFRKIKNLLKELKSFNVDEIRFHGQEPTLRSDLIEIIAWAKKMKFSTVALKTNCIFLDRNYVKELIRAGLDSLYVSIDSPVSKIHNKMRRLVDSFEKNIKAVEFIKRYSRGKVKVFSNSVVTNLNYNSLDLMPALAKKYDIDRVSFVQISSKNKEDIADLKLNLEQMEEFFFRITPRIIKKCLNYKVDFDFSPFFADLVGLPPTKILDELKNNQRAYANEIRAFNGGLYGVVFYKKYGCFGSLDHCSINYDGNVFSCCVIERNEKSAVGNINKTSFKDIWNSKEYILKRRTNGKDCQFYSACSSNFLARKALHLALKEKNEDRRY